MVEDGGGVSPRHSCPRNSVRACLRRLAEDSFGAYNSRMRIGFDEANRSPGPPWSASRDFMLGSISNS